MLRAAAAFLLLFCLFVLVATATVFVVTALSDWLEAEAADPPDTVVVIGAFEGRVGDAWRVAQAGASRTLHMRPGSRTPGVGEEVRVQGVLVADAPGTVRDCREVAKP
jgi:hypothetical protein